MLDSEKRLSCGQIRRTSRVLILLVTFCLLLCSCAPVQEPDGKETSAADITAPHTDSGLDTSELVSESDAAETASEPEDSEAAFQPGRLPVLYIHIDGGAEEVQKMNDSEDHSYRCTGTMDLEVPEGYQSAVLHTSFESVSDLEMEYIRGRGNSSWGGDKRPYKIKLDKKQNFFDMGKSKHWVLLANSSDNTLLRNSMSLWLAAELGLPYTPQFVFTDVVMEGEYLGSYYLAEQVRVEESRVDLAELKEDMTEEPEIRGGYLLALHPDQKDPEEDKFVTAQAVDFLHVTPSFAADGGDYQNDAQRDYIRSYVQKTEDAIFSGDYTAAASYLDMTSAADYWWMQELCENLDAYRTSSTYLYKDREAADGSEGKLFFGPVWDFDYAWGNVLEGTPNPEGFQHAEMPWTPKLFLMPEFSKLVKERWSVIDPLLEEMTAPNGILDQYAEEIRDSWEMDRKLRDSRKSSSKAVVFDDAIRELRMFIEARRSWINDNLERLDKLYSTVTLKVRGEFYQKLQLYTGSTLSVEYACIPPQLEGQYFIGWYTDDGQLAEEYLPVLKDTVLDARYIPEEEVTFIEELVFEETEVQVSMSDGTYRPVFKILPEDAIDQRIQWSVSDEALAMVDEENCVILLAAGDVTLTATLHNGKTASLLLHIKGD